MRISDWSSDVCSSDLRFRGFLPVVVDVETGGFNSQTDALLEIAAVILGVDEHGKLFRRETSFAHVTPFPGANIEKAALEVTGIRIDSPLRLAMAAKDALEHVFRPVRRARPETGCPVTRPKRRGYGKRGYD